VTGGGSGPVGGALAVVLLAGCAMPSSQRHTATARLDGHLAREARRADALGLTPEASLSKGPARIGDLLRAMDPEGAERHRRREVAPAPSIDGLWLAEVLERREREVEDAWDDTGFHDTFIAPLEEPRLRYVVVDGPVSFQNEQGRQFHQGSNLYLSNRSVARVAERLVLAAEPELSYVENRNFPDDDRDLNGTFQELAASLRLGPLEVTAGRMPLWWGPGRHGALLLTNNARPFDLVKLSTAGPQLLPGFLGYLGLLQGEVFVTRLERNRAVARPFLAGARLSSRLNPYLEIGASRTAQFGGAGRPVDAGTIWKVITARTENEEDGDPGNQLASIDVRLIVPWAVQPFEIYGEIGGEDEADYFFAKEAFVAGIYLPRIGPCNLLEFTFEMADMSRGSPPGDWYRNRNYPDGYTYHRRIIGHHAGTDGMDLFHELRIHAARDLVAVISYDYEEHFRLSGVEERLHQIRIGLEKKVGRGFWIWAFYQHGRWRNFRRVPGDDEEGHAVSVGGMWRFGG
jgi:hypothetical protein